LELGWQDRIDKEGGGGELGAEGARKNCAKACAGTGLDGRSPALAELRQPVFLHQPPIQIVHPSLLGQSGLPGRRKLFEAHIQLGKPLAEGVPEGESILGRGFGEIGILRPAVGQFLAPLGACFALAFRLGQGFPGGGLGDDAV
jgi:hypothetical protein